MRFLGGHLGSSVSALVDGQLDNATTERAWSHVLGCPQCRAEVEREIWVKNRLALLAGDEPAPRLVEMLHELASSDPAGVADDAALFPGADRSARARRLTALALLGVGSVSAAVFAVATWGGPLGLDGRSGAPASIGEATPSATPSSPAAPGSGTTQPGPRAHVTGTLEGWRAGGPGLAVPTTASQDR
jgi:hypothetical protein